MRVLFMGTARFAVPSLEQLVAQGHEVVRCVTQPERPQGRGLKPLPSPVKSAAQRLQVPVEEPDALRDAVTAFQECHPDVGVVISYGQLIPPALLQLPVHGMLGLHPSLLPKYRGASPIAWAILRGEAETGATVFRLNERLDAGELLGRRAVPIEPRDTTPQLSERLARLGAALLLEGLGQLAAGTAQFTPQDERLATYAPKLTKADGRIEWAKDAVAIDRLVRALTPWPGAYTTWQGRLLKVWQAVPDGDGTGRPGEVLATSADGVAVATGQGRLRLQDIQLAGRRRMSAQEFLAGHPIHIGERLGGDQ
ncbi:MAG: methionyl-tRNA formyltransferase [Candidatus Omnitrophica bacterium]|nr:methionyl-tRNA formyltransferase [Candidatus Omnitrophota bacterium]